MGPGPVRPNAAIIVAMKLARDCPDVVADKVVGWWVFLLGSRPGAARRRMAVQLGRGLPKGNSERPG